MAYRTRRPLEFGDCDPSGIGYFPSYLDTLSGIVEEFFQDLGFPWHVLIRQRRIGTPTVRLDVTFERPGFYGDTLEFSLQVGAIGRSSLDLRHRICVLNKQIWTAEQKLVAMSLETHRAVSWPDDVRLALEQRTERC